MNSKPKDPPPSPWLSLRIPCSPQQWADFKQRLLNLIQEMHVEKAVLARQVEASYPHFPTESVRRYLQESKDPKDGNFVDLMLSITCTLAGWQKREPLERFYQLVAPLGGFDRQTFRRWVGRGTSPLDGALPTLPDTVNALEGLHKALANSVMHESVTLNHQHLVALCGGTGAERRNQFAALVQHDGVHEHDIGAVLLRSVADKAFDWDALETALIELHNRITPFGKSLVLVLLDDVSKEDCAAVRRFVQTYDARALIVVGANRWSIASELGVAEEYVAKLQEIPLSPPPRQTNSETAQSPAPSIAEPLKLETDPPSSRQPLKRNPLESCSPDLRLHAEEALRGFASLRAVGYCYLHSIQTIRVLTKRDDAVNVQVKDWLFREGFAVTLEDSGYFGATDKAVDWLHEQGVDVNLVAAETNVALDAIPSYAENIVAAVGPRLPNLYQSFQLLIECAFKQTPVRRFLNLKKGFYSWSSIEDYLTSKNIYVPIETRSTVDTLRLFSRKHLKWVLLVTMGCILAGAVFGAAVEWILGYSRIFSVGVFVTMICIAILSCLQTSAQIYLRWIVLWRELRLPV